jgi:hypothetical protein
MGWFVSEERVPVEGVACQCDGTPHPHGDTIWLRAELTPEGAYAAAVASAGEGETMEQVLGWTYLVHGIVDWTFLDERGKPIPCTKENIRRLDWTAVYPVAQKASQLGYSEALVRPLVASVSRSSRNGQTDVLTSVAKGSSRPRQRR